MPGTVNRSTLLAFGCATAWAHVPRFGRGFRRRLWLNLPLRRRSRGKSGLELQAGERAAAFLSEERPGNLSLRRIGIHAPFRFVGQVSATR